VSTWADVCGRQTHLTRPQSCQIMLLLTPVFTGQACQQTILIAAAGSAAKMAETIEMPFV